MAEQWYWKHRGETIGPLCTEELERFVQQRRVFDHDQVRLTESDEWLSGAEIKALFVERARTSTAEAASRLLDEAARRQLNRPAEASGSVFTDALRGMSRRARVIAEGLLEIVGDALAGVLAIFAPLFNRKVIAVVLGVVVISLLLPQMDLGRFENPRIYARLTATYQRMQELQQSGEEISPEQWRAFQEQTRRWLDPAIESLEEANAQFPVNSHHPFGDKSTALARISLLDAAKAFRSILDQFPAPSGHIWQFEQAMGGANQFITGEPDPRYPAPNQRYSLPESGTAVDTTTLVVIAGGVGLLVGGLSLWFIRRRTGN